MPVGVGLGDQGCPMFKRASTFIRRNAASHDQARFATCAFGVQKAANALKASWRFLEANMHGPHDHPVAQSGKSEIEGTGQVWELVHEVIMQLVAESIIH